MAKQVQELIDKIKHEGFDAAQKKAQAVEAEADQKAKAIVSQAEKQAKDIIEKAEQQAQQFQKTSQAAIQQAARDTLLDLKKEIQQILDRLMREQTHTALTPEALADIIKIVALDFHKKGEVSDVRVSLSPEDLQTLKKGALAKLKEELKKDIHFKSADEMAKGFVISFDSGKSSFDFTDESLAAYISGYLNEELQTLLKIE